jgi:hypothetical protein
VPNVPVPAGSNDHRVQPLPASVEPPTMPLSAMSASSAATLPQPLPPHVVAQLLDDQSHISSNAPTTKRSVSKSQPLPPLPPNGSPAAAPALTQAPSSQPASRRILPLLAVALLFFAVGVGLTLLLLRYLRG